MSYDVHLEVDTGAGNTVEAYWRNMTSNVAGMWCDAGADLREMKGRCAAECVPLLTAAIDKMVADPARYRAMEPSNGWGTYEGTLEFLRALRDAMQDHPATTVRVGH